MGNFSGKKVRLAVGLGAGLLAGGVFSGEVGEGSGEVVEEKATRREQFVMLIEPKLMGAEVSRPVPGSKLTVFAAARETEYGGVRYYDKEEFSGLGLSWEAFFLRAQRSADGLMEGLEPEYVRDHREVIQYAVLRSKSQRTAGVILGRKFREKFLKTMGPELVVVVPDRMTVFVFSKLAGDYGEYGPAMVERYEDAVYPASAEVFEVGEKGVRVIGVFSRG